MKRKLGIIVAVAIALSCLLAFAACGEVATYTVTLDYGYGSKTETVSVAEGTVFTLPSAQRGGYTFNGWKDSSGNVVSVATVTADATFTAQWTEILSPDPVTVTYTVPDGQTAPSSATALPGETITLPNAPEIDGKQFVGWQNSGVTYAEGGKVTVGNSALTFDAVYKTEVAVRYVISGIQGATAPQAVTLLEGDIMTVADAPVVDGYQFVGWTYGSKTYQGGDLAIVAEEGPMVFTAQYKKEITLTFTAGQENWTVEVLEGDTYTLPYSPAESGKVFKGWTVVGGGADVLAAGSAITVPSVDTQYAASLVNTFPVFFYDESCTFVVETQYVEEGQSAVAPQWNYPQHYGEEWWLSFNGFDNMDDIHEATRLYPKYDKYVPSDESLFAFYQTGDTYEVYYTGFATGMGSADVKTLLLPAEHNGAAVTGIYNSSANTNVNATNVKKGGFALSSILQKVYVPSSYTKLGLCAFYQDTALKEVVIDEDAKITAIDNGAFYGCTALTSFTIPEGVKTIGTSAFDGASLASIVIPGSVTDIQTKAFQACPLAEVTFEQGSEALVFGDSAFAFAASLNAKSPTTWPLTSFTFPARTTKIGKTIFNYNMHIKSITFEEPTDEPLDLELVDGAFAASVTAKLSSSSTAVPYSPELKSITLPARTKVIGKYVFNAQIYLEEINFEEGMTLTSLGEGAFAATISLKELKIPAGITEIPQYLYLLQSGALKYKTAENPNTAITPTAGQFGFNTASATKLTIPAGVTSLGNQAFAYQHALAEISFPASLTTLGNNVFQMNVNAPNDALTTLNFPTGLTKLGTGGFGGPYTKLSSVVVDCPNLTEFTGFSGVTAGGAELEVIFRNITQNFLINNAFYNNCNLKKVTFEDSCTGNITITKSFYGDTNLYGTSDAEYLNGTASNGQIKSCKPCKLDTVKLPKNLTLTLPVSLPGDKVAFSNLEKLETLNFGESSKYSFKNGGIYLTEDGEVTLIGYLYAVFAKSKTVTIEANTTKIAPGVFSRMGLTEVTIPDTVKEIGQHAFSYNAFKSVEIKSNVKVLGSNSFNGNAQLTTVKVDAEIINNAAFTSCNKLETVEIGANVHAFDVGAFSWPNESGSAIYKGLPLTVVTIKGAAFTSISKKHNTTAKDDQFTAEELQGRFFFDSTTAFGNVNTMLLALNDEARQFMFLVDSAEIAAQYAAVTVTVNDTTEYKLGEALVKAMTHEKVTVTFNGTEETVTLPKGSKLIPSYISYEGKHWATKSAEGETYTLVDKDTKFTTDTTLYEVVGVTFKPAEGDAKVYYLVPTTGKLSAEQLEEIAALLGQGNEWKKQTDADKGTLEDHATTIDGNLTFTEDVTYVASAVTPAA